MKAKLYCERVAYLVIAMLIAVHLGASASAQTILIDLGNNADFRSVTVPNPDINGNFWNSVSSSAFFPNILDISGNPTVVDYGFSADGGHDSFNGPAGVTSDPPTAGEVAATDIDAAALGNLGVKEAAFDFYVNSRFQIQQLDLTKSYNLTFFGSHKFNNDNTTRYTIYTNGTFSVPVTSADLLVGVNNLHNRDTVVTISGVVPQPDGIIYVGFAGAAGGNGYLNSLRITAVPEPTSLLLMVGGVAMVFGFRRR